MLESVDRANRIKCDINNIGEARLQAGPLIRMIWSNQKTTVEFMRIVYLTVKEEYSQETTTDRSRFAIKYFGSSRYKGRINRDSNIIWITGSIKKMD